MLQNWLKLYEAVTKPLPLASSLFLFLATSFLLLANDSTLTSLGLSPKISEHRWVVGLLLLVAVTWIVVTLILWLGKWGNQGWSAHQARKKQHHRLHSLTTDERRILSGYVAEEVRSRIFHAAPDLAAVQGLADDGILYRPDVLQDEAVAAAYNIQEWALAYLSKKKNLVAPVVSAETRWSSTEESRTNSSPDWFARGTALFAIVLTGIGLYFTQRTYSWQARTYEESLGERILVRLGFNQAWELERFFQGSEGDIGVEVVNIGMHPIYVKYVEIQVPSACKTNGVKTGPDVVPDGCRLPIYDHRRAIPDEHLKPLEPGEATDYTTKWDFSKFPLQEWLIGPNGQGGLWVEVETTKKSFRQRPVFAEMSGSVPQERRSPSRSKK